MTSELQYFLANLLFAYALSCVIVFQHFQTRRSIKRRLVFAILWLPLFIMVSCESKNKNR